MQLHNSWCSDKVPLSKAQHAFQMRFGKRRALRACSFPSVPASIGALFTGTSIYLLLGLVRLKHLWVPMGFQHPVRDLGISKATYRHETDKWSEEPSVKEVFPFHPEQHCSLNSFWQPFSSLGRKALHWQLQLAWTSCTCQKLLGKDLDLHFFKYNM